MQCFREGGQVKYESRKEHKEEMKADIDQDKKIIKKAIAMHDKQEHKGEKTDLSKLNKGGRAKKAKGSVKKFKAGGEVTNVYEAKKASGDKDNIKKVKDIKAVKLCGGKSVNKMAMGGEVETAEDQASSLLDPIRSVGKRLKENILGTDEQNKVAQANLDKQAAQGSKLAKALGGKPAQAPSAPVNQSQGPFNKKRGGKVC